MGVFLIFIYKKHMNQFQKGALTPIIIIIIIVIIVLGVIIYYTSQPQTKENIDLENKTTMEDGNNEIRKGSYEAYSPEKLSFAVQGDVVLFFRASWCPTCRGLETDILANLDKIPEGVVILDVNYDTATELKQKYGITYQHTFVQVDEKGNQITKWVGSPTLASLLTNIK